MWIRKEKLYHCSLDTDMDRAPKTVKGTMSKISISSEMTKIVKKIMMRAMTRIKGRKKRKITGIRKSKFKIKIKT
jgi:hypothetical protein